MDVRVLNQLVDAMEKLGEILRGLIELKDSSG
jgi:hypothetical protein